MRFPRPLLAFALLGLLALPLPALALVERPEAPAGIEPTYDSPSPRRTPRPTQEPGSTPRPPRGGNQPGGPGRGTDGGDRGDGPPSRTAPIFAAAPARLALTPARTELAVGLPADDAAAAAPLQLALERGFFEDAGFEQVSLEPTASPLEGLAAGELDFAVVDLDEAAAAFLEDPSLQAVAGYHNYAGDDLAYGGSVLLAAPGLVDDEPATVSAFTKASIRALRTLAAPDDEPSATAAFAPFDGGFGARAEDQGWAELEAYLQGQGLALDPRDLVSEHTLNVAQASAGVRLNPAGDFAGKPDRTDIVVGAPAATLAGSPLALALEEGYFDRAGLTDVRLMEVEEPLLGVLQGDLDLAVLDQLDAADGAAQGLPLVALAGHRNYASDGAYGGDLLAASTDFVAEQGAATSAFLTAYVRALLDLESAEDAGPFAPFDGGFGALAAGDGLGELGTRVADALGADADVDALVDSEALHRAQTWWGRPANPQELPDGADATADTDLGTESGVETDSGVEEE